jgi:hypothetical protein
VKAFELGGRRFESVRARNQIKVLAAAEHLALSNIRASARGAPPATGVP